MTLTVSSSFHRLGHSGLSGRAELQSGDRDFDFAAYLESRPG